MRLNLPTAALAASLAGSTLNCGHARPPAPEGVLPETQVAEGVRKTAGEVLTLTIEGPWQDQICQIAKDDPVLTEPFLDNPELNCQGYLIACREAWATPIISFPYRQLWPEVFRDRRLNLFHPAHMSLFACPEGSRMVTDNQYDNPGPTACLENRFRTVEEKGASCMTRRPEMIPVVDCIPVEHKKTVSWECAFDWLALQGRR